MKEQEPVAVAIDHDIWFSKDEKPKGFEKFFKDKKEDKQPPKEEADSKKTTQGQSEEEEDPESNEKE